jgi:MSHA biogenesis protein MshM
MALGLEPAYRRARLWRDLKARIQELADSKQLLLVWIIDEAQNLPPEFFRDFPAFLNFAFDSRELMTVWLVGHPGLAHTLNRAPYAALAGRILKTAMRMAVPKGLNHLPDDLLQQAIEALR